MPIERSTVYGEKREKETFMKILLVVGTFFFDRGLTLLSLFGRTWDFFEGERLRQSFGLVGVAFVLAGIALSPWPGTLFLVDLGVLCAVVIWALVPLALVCLASDPNS